MSGGALEAEIEVADRGVDVALGAEAGRVVALVGPNGSGKTTVLEAIAGLLRPDRARVTLAGRVIDDTATGTATPLHRRRIGLLTQQVGLFTHLSVIDNVAFGLWARRRRRDARREAAGWLDRLGLGELAHRRADRLSGGQAQRVALARALAAEPDALLLDEPLAALDAAARAAARHLLADHVRAFAGPVVMVTHDPVDVVELAHEVIELRAGRIDRTEPVHERLARRGPSDVDRNVVTASAHGDRVRLGDGTELMVAEAGEGPVQVLIDPRALGVHRRRPGGSPRNVLGGTVRHISVEGRRVRVVVETAAGPLAADLTVAAAEELDLAIGVPVWLTAKATALEVLPA